MREECASRRERGSSHHTGINAVGTQEKINVLGAESPSQLREGKAPPTQPPVRTKRKGHTQRLCLAVFFSVFRESAKTGRSMGWRVHGVRNRPFQHTYLTWLPLASFRCPAIHHLASGFCLISIPTLA